MRKFIHITGIATLAAGLGLATVAQANEVVEVSEQQALDAKAVAEGLFPEEACEELVKAGFKCMGFKPAVRYALPATAFRVGSAELPDALKRQLEVFAQVLAGKKGNNKAVRIEGHADASGSADVNQQLSQRRAEAVKEFLVARGAEASQLVPVGMGAKAPKVSGNPFAAENRRVEIGRQTPPEATAK